MAERTMIDIRVLSCAKRLVTSGGECIGVHCNKWVFAIYQENSSPRQRAQVSLQGIWKCLLPEFELISELCLSDVICFRSNVYVLRSIQFGNEDKGCWKVCHI